jgi:transposase InsO family protein
MANDEHQPIHASASTTPLTSQVDPTTPASAPLPNPGHYPYFVQEAEATPPMMNTDDDFFAWVISFKRAIRNNNWPEARVMSRVRRCMPWHILDWMEQHEEQCGSFSSFETAYKNHVQTPAYVAQAQFELDNFQMDASKSLEAYNASMTLLFERADITEDKLQKRYYLRSISDDFHDYIAEKEPATYEDAQKTAIKFERKRRLRRNAARTNMAAPALEPVQQPTPTSILPRPHHQHRRANPPPVTRQEAPTTSSNRTIDELTQKLEKLSLSVIQLNELVRQRRTPRAGRDLSNITCFRCQKKGHYSPECPEGQSQTSSTRAQAANSALGTLDVLPDEDDEELEFEEHDYFVEEEDESAEENIREEESEEEIFDEEELELYAVTRSQTRALNNKSSSPYTAPPKQVKEVAKRARTAKTVRIASEMDIDPPVASSSRPRGSPRPVVQEQAVPQELPRTQEPRTTNTSAKAKDKVAAKTSAKTPVQDQDKTPSVPKKMAMMKGRQDYDIITELHNTPANISMAQLLYHAPSIRSQLSGGVRKVELGLNEIFLEAQNCTSAQMSVTLYGHKVEAVADTGAAMTVISKSLADELALEVLQTHTVLLVTADGKRHRSQGFVASLPVRVDGVVMKTPAVVFDRKGTPLILGMNWMRAYKVSLHLGDSTLRFLGPDQSLHILNIKTSQDEPELDYDADAQEFDFGLLIQEIPDESNDEYPLSQEEALQLDAALDEYSDVFANDIAELEGEFRTNVQHVIDTGDHPPVHVRPYRIPRAHADEAEKEITKMLEAQIIEPSVSPWCAPVLPIKKKDGGLRICIDYRKLNEITIKDAYPLPRIDDILDTLHGATVFSTLDALSGYWQIPVAARDQEKTAFAMLGKGLYQFRVMPFGLSNAPSTFQRCMTNLFRELAFVHVYIDDILVFSTSIAEHLDHLRQVFAVLRKNHFKLKSKKCRFARSRTEYLGFMISDKGIAPVQSKLDALRAARTPSSRRDVQSFLGLASYYRRFVPKFSEIARPLNWLLKKDQDFVWEDRQEEAYRKIIDLLTTAPILVTPDWERTFILTTDASTVGVAAILSQNYDDGEHPICYASRSLSKAEANYSPTHLEGLAIVWAVAHFRHYIAGRHFKLRTDHSALTSLFTTPKPLTGRLARWSMLLREYDFTIEHLKGKTNPADYPSRLLGPTAATIEQDCDEFDLLAMQKAPGGMDYPLYLALSQYLTALTYPEGATESDRAKLRKRASKYAVQDGVLVRRRKPGPLGPLEVLHERNCQQIVQRVHNEHHSGVDNTLHHLTKRYCGPNLRATVQDVVSTCDICQRHNPSTDAARAEPLHPIEAPRPLAIVGLDVVGPIRPPAADGSQYILTAIDYHTRWPIAMAAKEADTTTLIQFLLDHVISTFGVPDKVITDRGSIFTSEVLQTLFRQLKVRHRPTTAYRPQANGRVERMHRTLNTILAKITTGDNPRWPQHLWKALLTIRTMVHEGTRFTPAELMYGFEPVIPAVWKPSPTRVIEESPEETAEARMQHMRANIEDLRAQAAEHSSSDQWKQTARYDAGVRPRSFADGALVLLKVLQPNASTGTAKFSSLYEGPYTVVRAKQNGVYEITDGQGSSNTVHIDRLKAYRTKQNMIEQVIQGAKPIRSTLRQYIDPSSAV